MEQKGLGNDKENIRLHTFYLNNTWLKNISKPAI